MASDAEHAAANAELAAAVKAYHHNYAARMKEGFAELGAFVCSFSQLESALRIALGAELKLPADLAQIALSLYDFTALCKVWRLVRLHQHPEYAKYVEATFSACMAVNTERVRVAHGVWSLGEESLEATHIERGSLKTATHFASRGALKRLVEKCDDLVESVVTRYPDPSDFDVIPPAAD